MVAGGANTPLAVVRSFSARGRVLEKLAAALLKVDAFWQRIGRGLAVFAGGVVIVMTILVVVDVSRRFLANDPIEGAAEALALMLPHVICLSLAYTLVVGGHVRVSLLFNRLPPKLQLWADSLGCVTSLVLLGVLVYWGWLFFWESFVQNEYMMARVYLPWWAGKFALPAGAFVFLIQFLLRLLLNLGRLTNIIQVAEIAEEVTEKVQRWG